MRHLLSTLIATMLCVVGLNSQTRAQNAGFTDIPSSHWAAESVNKLVGMGILQGPTATKSARPTKAKFDGDKPVTRYELAVILYRFVKALEKADAQPKSKMGADITGPDAVKFLVSNGYLLRNSPLAADGNKIVTANQLADASFLVFAKIKEKGVPISPGSKHAPD